jgi:triacylglycerol esterase/lipase EstA (alpha/beta hydrolase family)
MSLPSVIVPGYFASAIDYQQLEQELNRQGIPTITVPLKKSDWFSTLGGRSIAPIIKKLDRTVEEVLERYGVSEVNLIAHSAGGWISRIYMGDKPYDIHGDVTGEEAIWSAHSRVNTLITLGTPHRSLERWTKKNLNFVEDTYPGAFHGNIKYICIAGKAVYGKKQLGSWLAYQSYQITCGEGNSWGDGITPIACAHLKGATNITLEGVWHSPKSPNIWYGSIEPLKAWIDYLV